MKSKKLESLGNRIRGWLPQEPKLPRNYAGNRSEKKNNVLDKPLNQLSLDTILSVLVGFLLIILGVLGFVFNDLALATVQNIALFVPLVSFVGYLFAFWIVVGAVVIVVILVRSHVISKAFVQRNLTKRRLLPYGVSAIIIFSAYLASNSDVQFAYAIPITFLVSGIMVVKGLKRFAVTLPAFAVLLVSILVLGCSVAGVYAVTYISEDRFLTSAQTPNVDTVNLSVKSVAGDIRLYFVNDNTQICHIAFAKEYGAIFSSNGAEYHGPANYDNEPATSFNYTVENGHVNVTAWSYTVLVNITVNQNLKLNLDFYTYFGDITVEAPPPVNSIQTMNLTTQLGDVKLKIPNTTNLQSVLATSPYTVEAYISSTSQNQNATVQLKGGIVKLDLKLTNIESRISAYSTGKYGELEAKTQGFTVLNQNNTYFNAQTPRYSASALKKLDITATSTQSTRPSMDITANYI